MLDGIDITFKEIFRKCGAHDNFILDVFNAMETSDEAMIVVLFSMKRDEWEERTLVMSLSQLMSAAT